VNQSHYYLLIYRFRETAGNLKIMNTDSEKPKVIVICGPTAIGKTAVSIKLAAKFGGEIISADSMQIYRHMDIGTAKPTVEELAQITHHMIDIVDPDDDYDAVQFSKQARRQIAKIINRGLIPFIVGGTGLYIKALLHGLFQSQPIDPRIRSRLKQEAEENGSGFLFERLKKIDPAAADRIHPNDSYRILRALETIESSGKTITEYHQTHGFADDPFTALKIGLQLDRQDLYTRIDNRVELMIVEGLVEEVRKLLDMGYVPELKSMQSIGYRHMVEFLAEKLPWDECIRTLKRDTRRFAKRQFTWFGADQNISWHSPAELKSIISLVRNFKGH
jgi:tRNA dimethylallyltransferase